MYESSKRRPERLTRRSQPETSSISSAASSARRTCSIAARAHLITITRATRQAAAIHVRPEPVA